MTERSEQLHKLFEPKSIAVVGAAREEGKLGNIIVANIVAGGYRGQVMPINPNAEAIRGFKCYPSYSSLPITPDLAIIALPADLALSVLTGVAAKGTKQVLIFAAGFKEIGGEGEAREAKLIKLASDLGLSVIGPNCLGFINNTVKLNATFGQAEHTMGNVRFISQSGAIATCMFDWAHLTGVGFSDFVTLGNKTVLSELDVLDYWNQRDDSKILDYLKEVYGVSKYQPIGFYLESIQNGQAFVEAAAKAAQKNPVFILKPGKSVAAQKASQSHTGALANDDAVLDAALEKCGVIRTEGVENFFDLARSFAWENAPEGPKIAIVSNAGGPAVITTDAIASAGLELAPMSDKTTRILEKNLPRAANIHNPVDVLGDALADRYEVAMDAVLSDHNVDALIVILTPQVMTQIEETASIIGKMSVKHKKPILCSFMGGTLISQGEAVLNKNRIPSFHYPERAVKVFASMWKWRQWQKKWDGVSFKKEQILSAKSLSLLEDQVKSWWHNRNLVLSSEEAQNFAAQAGFKVAPGVAVQDNKNLPSIVEKLGLPLVLKISSSKLLHKTEAGGVIKNLRDLDSVRRGVGDLREIINKLEDPNAKIILEKQIEGGVEIIAGFKRDQSFGPVIMVGAGGVLAELIADRNLSLPYLSRNDLLRLVKNSKANRLLSGWRGQEAYKIDPLVDALGRLQDIALNMPEIKEMEINPIIVTKNAAYAVDTKIVLG